MKLTLRALFALLVAGVVLTSCNKDDDKDDPVPTHYFKYNNTYYELTKGFLENYGEWDSAVYNLDLTMMSDGINVTVTGDEITGISGSGDVLYFEMYTTDSTQLVSGTYTFDTSWNATPFTFDIGMLGIDYNLLTQTGTTHMVTGGTVTVSKSGSTYDISWNLKDEAGRSITGKFKKSLTLVNVSWKSPEPKGEYTVNPMD